MGLHNHQPVGNFDFVFDEAHKQAYLPFLELFQNYENISISLHQSGILWDWQEKHYPEYLELVKKLVSRGQLELLTGGFYEPILTAIPERDVIGQIKLLTKYLKDKFDVVPEGLWLTERIWEPHLPKVLTQAGVQYLPVDDTHFIYAGFEHDDLTGPYITEHENHTVKLLPISKFLRYMIPFGTVKQLIDEMKRLAEKNPSGMVIYADDGEKFGVWPKTHEHCYTNKWLENFFNAVLENSDWLEIVPLSHAAGVEPVGRAYLPSASYAEMLHWSLPPLAFVEYENFEHFMKMHHVTDIYSRFVRGGHWRGFLTKYEESNLMHKKMMAVSDKLNLSMVEHADKKEALDGARDKLYAGQCNCPYWHGVFGGLYLPHIRRAVYSSLVEADSVLNGLNSDNSLRVKQHDYDCDGKNEIMVESPSLTGVFKPDKGGMLLELSLNALKFSLTDTLTRRKEGYHIKLDRAVTENNSNSTASIHDLVLAKEEGLKNLLVEDGYMKRCFLDHFFDAKMNFDNFKHGKIYHNGEFVNSPYECEIKEEAGVVLLSRKGAVNIHDKNVLIELTKKFDFSKAKESILIDYELKKEGAEVVEIILGVENNFNFQAGHAEDRYIMIDSKRNQNAFLDSDGVYPSARQYSMLDEYSDIGVGLQSDKECELWHTPIFTVSLSESGFEKVYQGTTFVNLYRLQLADKPVQIKLLLTTGKVSSLRG